MSKKEIINKMIEEGKSFEEIVVESGAKQSYVKSCFTKLGKDWEDSDDPNVELVTQIAEIEEEVVEEVVEEAIEVADDVQVLEIDEDIDVEAFIREVKSKQIEDARKRRQLQAQIRRLIVMDLTQSPVGRNKVIIHRMSKRCIRSKQQKYILRDLVKDIEKYFKIVE
jgi:hypothetical protein